MAETVVERLTGAWARTDRIFEILAPGAFLAQPIALRHPFIFYVGHLPAFAWNHICAGVLRLPSLNAGFDELFSRGIDPDVTLIPMFRRGGRRSPPCSPTAIGCARRCGGSWTPWRSGRGAISWHATSASSP